MRVLTNHHIIIYFVADTKSEVKTAVQCRLDPLMCLLTISHTAVPDGFQTLDLSERKATCRLCASLLNDHAAHYEAGRLFGFALVDFKSSGF